MTEQADDLETAINQEIEQEAVQETEQKPTEEKTDAIAESVPAQEETPAESDGVQKRINKITAEKYEEKRRADELEKRLKAIESQPVQEAKEPALEDFDYDDAKYQAALVQHQVQKALESQNKAEQERLAKERVNNMAQSFNAKVAEFTEKTADYAEVVSNVPQLPDATLEAVMTLENGPQVAYYLGKHLDVADEIASSSPIQAAIRLGEIRTLLSSSKPETKPSSAPDPVETITSGGGANKDVGEMSMEEIYNM